VDELADTAFSCITAACNATFKVSRRAKPLIKKTTVSWWTEELTVLRRGQMLYGGGIKELVIMKI